MTEPTLFTAAFALYVAALVVYSASRFARREKWAGAGFVLAVALGVIPPAAARFWSERAGVAIVKHKEGSDPAAVAYDAADAAVSRHADCLIVDTAGRLQTQQNLMQQLSKMHRVLGKQIPEAPHEVLLVLDATTGQNGISQAKHFTDAVKCTGIILAKLDGTAKGGVVVAIRQQVGLPVKYVGVGEHLEDLAEFDADSFVDAMFEDLGLA